MTEIKIEYLPITSLGVKVDNPFMDVEPIVKIIKERFDLTPKGIIRYLRLLDKDYEKLAEGCHYRAV